MTDALQHDFATSLGAGAALVGAVMLALWFVQRAQRNATAVDVAWAANLGLLAILYAALGSGLGARRIAVGAVVGAWSFRLAWHLFRHRILGHRGVEDGRYRTLREKWGTSANRKFLAFYLAQGLLDLALSFPFLVACANESSQFSGFELVGLALVAIAVTGETIADRQLARFRADAANRGRTCRVGLWRVSRHPNYFFEWLNWCGFAAIAWPAHAGRIAILAPLAMLFLIAKVTGIPPTEAQALRTRGDDYRRYQRTTSAFFPWFPKSKSAP